MTTAMPNNADALHCPVCDYDLTGLPELRCSECGTPFDPAELRRLAHLPPPAFERSRGIWRVPAFVVSWLTVLATPWLFARQTRNGLRIWPAAAFALTCFVSTLLSMFFGAELAFVVTWIATAAIYLVGQTVVLTLLDRPHWTQPGPSAAHWLAIGFYTSAIVMTEFTAGPPLITLEYLLDQLAGRTALFSTMKGGWEDAVAWTQVIVWLIGVVWCYDTRLARRRVWFPWRLFFAMVVFVGLLFLYAAAVEQIGKRLYDVLSEFEALKLKLF